MQGLHERWCEETSEKHRWDFVSPALRLLERRREWVSCPPDMHRNGENEILTMNQSELHSTPPEYLSRTEGQWRCETHTSSWRVEGDALVAKEYILLLGMRRWTGVICFTVAWAAAEICSTAAFSIIIWWGIHTCLLPISYFSLCFGPNQVTLVNAGLSQIAFPLTACVTLVSSDVLSSKTIYSLKMGHVLYDKVSLGQTGINKWLFFFCCHGGGIAVKTRPKLSVDWNETWNGAKYKRLLAILRH